MNETDLKLTLAWIAALGSFVAALFNHFSKRVTERELAELKDRLDQSGKDRDARRDYEYEARKKLYEACEPLIFQGVELAERALVRIQGLARTAAQGSLEPGKNSWLEIDEYYLHSTIYYLLAPLAIQRLLRERLTLLDQSLDPRIRTSYQLLREAFAAPTQDFRLAEMRPSLPYDPHGEHLPAKEIEDPAQYSWQGLAQGELENMVDKLIPRDLQGRYLSFGEFQRLMAEKQNRAVFQPILKLFSRFHPRLKPIFWRILLAQAHCYAHLGALHQGLGRTELREAEFDWRSPGDREPATGGEALQAARAYLQLRAPKLFQEAAPV